MTKKSNTKRVYGDNISGLRIDRCWTNFTFGPWYYRRNMFGGVVTRTVGLDFGPWTVTWTWTR